MSISPFSSLGDAHIELITTNNSRQRRRQITWPSADRACTISASKSQTWTPNSRHLRQAAASSSTRPRASATAGATPSSTPTAPAASCLSYTRPRRPIPRSDQMKRCLAVLVFISLAAAIAAQDSACPALQTEALNNIVSRCVDQEAGTALPRPSHRRRHPAAARPRAHQPCSPATRRYPAARQLGLAGDKH